MNCQDCNKLNCFDCAAELREQLEESELLNQRLTRICAGELHFEDDYVDINAGGTGAILFMRFLVDLFEKNGGENYLAWGIKGHGHDYSITIQNCDGELTPAMMIGQLQTENAALKTDNAALLQSLLKGYYGRTVDKLLAEEHPGAALLQELTQCEKALELLLDNLFEMDDETCPADTVDSGFDCDINICGVERPYKNCWKQYYLQQAKAGASK